jgi:hypothetical protein
MAKAIISRADLYPAGTKVKAYTLPALLPGEYLKGLSGDPETGTLKLTKLVEVTADASTGALTLETSIVEGQPMLLWAEVGSKDVYLQTRASKQTELD